MLTIDDYSAATTIVGATTPATPPDVTFTGAGDIASSGSGDDATANLLDGIPGTVFTIGDNVYPNAR